VARSQTQSVLDLRHQGGREALLDRGCDSDVDLRPSQSFSDTKKIALFVVWVELSRLKPLTVTTLSTQECPR